MTGGGRLAIAALLASGLMTLVPTGSFAKCSMITGTADGWTKDDASAGARAALNEAIAVWRAKAKPGTVSVTAMRPKPQPYWRSEVAGHLFLKPDIITGESHTVCWKGVVSPVVCTSGAKVCW
jgi:hypothetical protein